MASIEQAEAILAAAQIDLESVVLRAPFAGIVAEVAIDPGDFSGASAGAAIMIADVSTLRVDMHVSDLDIARVREGQRASIFIEGIPGERYSGRVRAIAPTAITHEGRRTFLVEIALDTWRDLRPGMSARVEIAIEQQTAH